CPPPLHGHTISGRRGPSRGRWRARLPDGPLHRQRLNVKVACYPVTTQSAPVNASPFKYAWVIAERFRTVHDNSLEVRMPRIDPGSCSHSERGLRIGAPAELPRF